MLMSRKKTKQNPGRYSAGENPLLPVPAGLLLLICLGFSIAAFTARNMTLITVLAGAELMLVILLRVDLKVLISIFRFFLVQSVVIVGLYILRFDPEGGIMPGFRISCQIVLAMAPGAIALNSIPYSRMMCSLNKILPAKTAFVLTTSLHFLPMLRREFQNIYQAQVIRGARITKPDLYKLKNWPDFIHCLLVPFIVQLFKITREIAFAARIRNFGIYKKRTSWPGNG